ncbi:hypothetical protein [Bradyrhizobium sp. Leo121]|uniref:hypothetical protein n=1 Tax=Bradyrhizobium sp. Leo121 TaxID=1571195 RepID=UPI0013EF33CD|nr:hypothetical protein [Bradyrhizobium sp. Leo121]
MTDFSEADRIGNGDGRSPAGGDRRQNLNRQRDQNDRKKSLQPLPHQPHPIKFLTPEGFRVEIRHFGHRISSSRIYVSQIGREVSLI